MALHLTPKDHNEDPPQGWTVKKATDKRWQLQSKTGGVIDTFTTKKDAEAAKTSGFAFNLYEKEGHWFKGETVPGWKPYEGPRV
jgi:hypothetical protein